MQEDNKSSTRNLRRTKSKTLPLYKNSIQTIIDQGGESSDEGTSLSFKSFQSFPRVADPDQARHTSFVEFTKNFPQNFIKGKYAVPIWDTFGGITTALAMVGQGIFGALWLDDLLRRFNVHVVVRIAPDILMLVAAEEGKRRLVRFFNTQSFKDLAELKTWKARFDPRSWRTGNTLDTSLDIIGALLKGGITIVASGVFAGLAAISFDESGKFLLQYGNKYTDGLARVAFNRGFQSPFMGAAFLANLLGFYYGIIPGAVALLKDAAYYVAENPQYRRLREKKLQLPIEAVGLDLKSKVENKQYAEVKQLAQSLLSESDTTINFQDEESLKQYLEKLDALLADGSLREKLLEISQNFQPTSAQTVLWREFFITHISATISTGVGAVGLYNFIKMTTDIISMIHVPYLSPALNFMAPFLSRLDYAAMSALAFNAIYPMVMALVARAFGHDPAINVISKTQMVRIIVEAIVICVLGGTPNAYQSLLANENTFMQILAIASSFLIELYGYYMLTRTNANNAAVAKDAIQKAALKIDEVLRKARDTKQITPEEIAILHSMQVQEQQQPPLAEVRIDIPHEEVVDETTPMLRPLPKQAKQEEGLIAEPSVPNQYRPKVQWLVDKFSFFRQKFNCAPAVKEPEAVPIIAPITNVV